MSELLCPAGNMEKLKAALRFGADAVYFAGKEFGMRSAADNFDIDEIYEAVRYTHALGKKLYLTVNTMPHWDEFDRLEDYLDSLRSSNIDAVIAADPGVIALIKERLPGTPIHISTQAGAVSHADCNFWASYGASRVVLARELSFEDIAAIRARIPSELELECFIHGAMCVSFSGRCLLSENLVGRDGNRGMCAQPCRWNYHVYEIEEEKRPGLRFPIVENDRGTFIMSSRDMCMIEHIDDLMRSGIASFKIEGRIKSAYYTAVTANAYRMAIDAYLRDPENYVFDARLNAELDSVSHREYCTGYYYDKPGENAQLVTQPGYIREKAYLAVVTDYDEETGCATFIQRNKLVEGESAELLTPGKVGQSVVVSELENEEGERIESAPHPNMIFTAKMPFAVKEGDILRSAQ